MKHERLAIHESNYLKRFEDYLLARGRKSAGRYLQVAQRFLDANPGEEDPFEAHHVNRFLAGLSRGARGRILRWNYYVVKVLLPRSVGLFYIVYGVGLWTTESWGWWIGMIMQGISVLSSFSAPVFLAISLAVRVYLYSVRALFEITLLESI